MRKPYKRTLGEVLRASEGRGVQTGCRLPTLSTRPDVSLVYVDIIVDRYMSSLSQESKGQKTIDRPVLHQLAL